jgi:hypothetical protein
LTLDDDIERIWKLIDEKKKQGQLLELRIFLITKDQWLRVYKGQMEKSMQLEELNFIRSLKAKRGDIINFFSKLEFLVNELVQARMLGLFSEKAYDFDQVLECIDFSDRLELLNEWQIINGSEMDKISRISSVRNQLAHRWSENEVSYRKDTTGKKLSISDNIQKFREDAEKIWMLLIDKYTIEEEKHIERVIQKLVDPNTINVWADIHKEQEEDNADDSKRFSPSI